MKRISKSEIQDSIDKAHLLAIKEKTGKDLFIGHLGSGRYWLGINNPSGKGYNNFGVAGHLSDKEMSAYIAGIHDALCL